MLPVGPTYVMLGSSQVPATQISPEVLQSLVERHSTHTAGSLERSHSGALLVQPASVMPTGALSTQTSQAGVVTLPLHTPLPAPSVHITPAMTGGNVQVPAAQVFVVQALLSLQSPLPVQPTHAKTPPPCAVHCGEPALQPRSVVVPS
jgi:hypothetical protein